MSEKEIKTSTETQVMPETPPTNATPPESRKSKKPWIIGCCIAAVAVIGIGGYVWYDNYQKSITPTYTLKEDTTLEYGQDPLSLIDCSDCTVTETIFKDSDGNEITDLQLDTPYSVVFTLDKNEHLTEVTKSVTLIDTEAPVLYGVADTTIDYGSEFDPMTGVTASDNVIDDVSIIVDGSVDPNVPGDYEITYKATDSSGNEATFTALVTVAVPTCGDNASWNGSSCVCDSGYEGDGFTGCTLIPQRTTTTPQKPASSGSTQTASVSSGSSNDSSSTSNTTNTYTAPAKSQAQIDCENSWGVWKDESWCDWSGSSDTSSNSNYSDSVVSWDENSMNIPIPDQSTVDSAINDGFNQYGDGGFAGIIGSDGSWIIGQ